MGQNLANDEELWRAALAHDQAAFGQLFDRHRHAVFRQALRMVHLPADAEELAGATFFELWRRRESVQLVRGSVLPWLLTAAARLSQNSIRARLRREALLGRLTTDGGNSSLHDFERIDEDFLRTDVVAALSHLNATDRALVTLTALEGYRIPEIAPVLGIGENVARVRLHRAHKKLRGLLGPSNKTEHNIQEVAQ